jgi:hypothetical protein
VFSFPPLIFPGALSLDGGPIPVGIPDAGPEKFRKKSFSLDSGGAAMHINNENGFHYL